MPTVRVTTRHGSKVHTTTVDEDTADFLERFGSAPSIDLDCGRHARIVRTPYPPATEAPCTQCARKETP